MYKKLQTKNYEAKKIVANRPEPNMTDEMKKYFLAKDFRLEGL